MTALQPKLFNMQPVTKSNSTYVDSIIQELAANAYIRYFIQGIEKEIAASRDLQTDFNYKLKLCQFFEGDKLQFFFVQILKFYLTAFGNQPLYEERSLIFQRAIGILKETKTHEAHELWLQFGIDIIVSAQNYGSLKESDFEAGFKLLNNFAILLQPRWMNANQCDVERQVLFAVLAKLHSTILAENILRKWVLGQQGVELTPVEFDEILFILSNDIISLSALAQNIRALKEHTTISRENLNGLLLVLKKRCVRASTLNQTDSSEIFSLFCCLFDNVLQENERENLYYCIESILIKLTENVRGKKLRLQVKSLNPRGDSASILDRNRRIFRMIEDLLKTKNKGLSQEQLRRELLMYGALCFFLLETEQQIETLNKEESLQLMQLARPFAHVGQKHPDMVKIALGLLVKSVYKHAPSYSEMQTEPWTLFLKGAAESLGLTSKCARSVFGICVELSNDLRVDIHTLESMLTMFSLLFGTIENSEKATATEYRVGIIEGFIPECSYIPVFEYCFENLLPDVSNKEKMLLSTENVNRILLGLYNPYIPFRVILKAARKVLLEYKLSPLDTLRLMGLIMNRCGKEDKIKNSDVSLLLEMFHSPSFLGSEERELLWKKYRRHVDRILSKDIEFEDLLELFSTGNLEGNEEGWTLYDLYVRTYEGMNIESHYYKPCIGFRFIKAFRESYEQKRKLIKAKANAGAAEFQKIYNKRHPHGVEVQKPCGWRFIRLGHQLPLENLKSEFQQILKSLHETFCREIGSAYERYYEEIADLLNIESDEKNEFIKQVTFFCDIFKNSAKLRYREVIALEKCRNQLVNVSALLKNITESLKLNQDTRQKQSLRQDEEILGKIEKDLIHCISKLEWEQDGGIEKAIFDSIVFKMNKQSKLKENPKDELEAIYYKIKKLAAMEEEALQLVSPSLEDVEEHGGLRIVKKAKLLIENSCELLDEREELYKDISALVKEFGF